MKTLAHIVAFLVAAPAFAVTPAAPEAMPPTVEH